MTQMFFTDQNLNNQDLQDNFGTRGTTLHDVEDKFMHFLLETQHENTFIYR